MYLTANFRAKLITSSTQRRGTLCRSALTACQAGMQNSRALQGAILQLTRWGLSSTGVRTVGHKPVVSRPKGY